MSEQTSVFDCDRLTQERVRTKINESLVNVDTVSDDHTVMPSQSTLTEYSISNFCLHEYDLVEVFLDMDGGHLNRSMRDLQLWMKEICKDTTGFTKISLAPA